MSRPIRVGILGASGYGAGELLRLLTQHPAAEVVSVVSSSQPGESIEALHPHLRGFYGRLRTSATLDWARLLDAEYAVVFSSLPHGTSGPALERVLEEVQRRDAAARTRLIDLSGDLRLRDVELHRRHYPESPVCTELRATAIYGLPELSRDEIVHARCISNPGCLATASILATAALASSGFRGTLVIDAVTGSSGSGRQLKETTHHPTRHADFRAYKPLDHQHEPEILQALGDPQGERLQLSFVPHSTDAARGIAVTAHLLAPDGLTAADVERRYAEFYGGAPFVRLVQEPPALQNVVGSNFCDIAVACREGHSGTQVVAMAALDNLVKGMAGTAIQNMNLMCGLAETTGLWFPAVRPV